MATLGRDYQAVVKDAGNVLVGLLQVRVGLPSIREAGTASVKSIQYVGTSSELTDNTTGTAVKYIKPLDMSTGGTLPAGCTLASAGTYTGAYDGCFIIRAASSTTVNIHAPSGYVEEGVTITSFASTPKDLKLASSGTSGCTLVGVPATTITAGQTWIIPVWSGQAQNKVHTGIISPYSPFSGAAESVGGLTAASFVPSISSIKTLETGFPSTTFDQLVEKTAVEISFSAQEFTNANLVHLQKMTSQIVNDSLLPSIPVEVVARTRKGDLKTFWCPSASMSTLASISPVNDFSSTEYKLTAVKQTEITDETTAYNIALKHANIYTQLEYVH